MVEERHLQASAADLVTAGLVMFDGPRGRFAAFLVPGDRGRTEVGHRRCDWVWYREDSAEHVADLLIDKTGQRRTTSVPPGALSEQAQAQLSGAAALDLPPSLRNLVCATRQPFLEAIVELSASRIAFGRIVLVGDAASVRRPNMAASIFAPAAAAMTLAAAVSSCRGDIVSALLDWEARQQRAASRGSRPASADTRSGASMPGEE